MRPDTPPPTEPTAAELLRRLAAQADHVIADLDEQAEHAESVLVARRESLHPVEHEAGRYRVEALRGAIRRLRRTARELRQRAATLAC